MGLLARAFVGGTTGPDLEAEVTVLLGPATGSCGFDKASRGRTVGGRMVGLT